MALSATVHHLVITLSDVDRGVYESLDLRVARHPSESVRYLLIRTLAYCLAYEKGVAFSKGGLSSSDEPPLTIHDPTGILTAWIDIGAPSADRMHKAAKAAKRVIIFTDDSDRVVREAKTRDIHRSEEIEVWRIDPTLIDKLEPLLDRNLKIELARNDGQLYVTIDGSVIEGSIALVRLSGE